MFNPCRNNAKVKKSGLYTLGGVAETRTVQWYIRHADMIKTCMQFKGTYFYNNEKDRNHIPFMHMFKAFLNCNANCNSLDCTA